MVSTIDTLQFASIPDVIISLDNWGLVGTGPNVNNIQEMLITFSWEERLSGWWFRAQLISHSLQLQDRRSQRDEWEFFD